MGDCFASLAMTWRAVLSNDFALALEDRLQSIDNPLVAGIMAGFDDDSLQLGSFSQYL